MTTTTNPGATSGRRVARRRRLAPACWLALALGAAGAALSAQSDRVPKVEIAWNRYYDYDGIVGLCRRLAASSDLCTLEFIGPSVEGRPMPLLTIENAATGEAGGKAAMWVDGNVHGNEVQGAEACVYLAWLLLERYGELDTITDLVDERVFYILPMVNPDGRQSWFDAPHTPHSSRSGTRPLDNDRDGLLDEDGPDDLDGDGELLMMRKRVAPGTGTHRVSPYDERLVERVPVEHRVERGADLVLLGREGYDNDGDGRVNEDGPGGYDMNRNWASGWQPPHIQYGAGTHPFSFPETKAIAEFILARPHIAAVQSFHNAGGMILRGPGVEARREMYPREDLEVYDAIAEEGERMLPFYRSLVIYDDLYDVHGGFVNWTAEGLGVVSFTNELWASTQYFGGEAPDEEQRHAFDRLVMFGETFVDWHETEHPDYGTVEVGGFRKMTGRTAPPFMIEEMLHRNAAFCVYHASQMPRLSLEEVVVEDAGGGARAVTVAFHNGGRIPTRTALAAREGIGRPDVVTIEGEDLVVLAGGPGASRFETADFDAVEHEPERLLIEDGVPGHGTLRVRWLVSGSGPFTVTLDTEKAGRVEARGTL